MSRLICAGCTGLIGRQLLPALRLAGHELVVLSRDPDRARRSHGRGPAAAGIDWLRWDALEDELPEALDGADGVINLCGAGIADRRWSTQRKQELRASRLRPSAAFAQHITQHAIPLLVQASAIGWYGTQDQPVDEDSPAGEDFLAWLCIDWEAAAEAAAASARVVHLRIGVVLDPAGGALARMRPAIGPLAWLGSGRQPFPWIQIEDVAGMILTAIADPRWRGPINAVAPEAVDQRTFIRRLAASEGRHVLPLGLPVWALRLAMGEMADMLVNGSQVEARRARELDYAWRHPDLASALSACASSRSVRGTEKPHAERSQDGG